MSDALAVAAVTAVLKGLLYEAVLAEQVVGNVTVTAVPPARIPDPGAQQDPQLNLFMYNVTPNGGWRPSGGAPPLALDLHYLLTAYGKEELHTEVLLGVALRTLHDRRILTADAIRQALASPAASGDTTSPPAGSDAEKGFTDRLAACGLADQVEQIRICPEVLTTEEVLRLWSAMHAQYRPTVSFQVSSILIGLAGP